MNTKSIADRLITAYTKQCVEQARKNSTKRPRFTKPSEGKIISSIANLHDVLRPYKDPGALDAALDAIDLAKIYSAVDARENDTSMVTKQLSYKDLAYEDLVVREALRYFKEDFFSWMDKPNCTKCGNNAEVNVVNGSRFANQHNPDNVSVIEHYSCGKCGTRVDFARINNPVSLLRTRTGRCGEWVNCFMLILHALVGSSGNCLRYVWNAEDHVWCEYYSKHLKRWIHLDPCENAFDEPHLYCENWGKKMSLVVGISDGYMIDLSQKYITREKRLPALVSQASLCTLLNVLNYQKLLRYYEESRDLDKLYMEVIVVKNQEIIDLKKVDADKTSSHEVKGRESGSTEWKKSRGEA